jgi:hypothetical protein
MARVHIKDASNLIEGRAALQIRAAVYISSASTSNQDENGLEITFKSVLNRACFALCGIFKQY